MMVIDASCMIDLMLQNSSFETIATEIKGQQLAAPHLLDVEVAQVMRKVLAGNIISQVEARHHLLVDQTAMDKPPDSPVENPSVGLDERCSGEVQQLRVGYVTGLCDKAQDVLVFTLMKTDRALLVSHR